MNDNIYDTAYKNYCSDEATLIEYMKGDILDTNLIEAVQDTIEIQISSYDTIISSKYLDYNLVLTSLFLSKIKLNIDFSQTQKRDFE